jgi:hypothetical protein
MICGERASLSAENAVEKQTQIPRFIIIRSLFKGHDRCPGCINFSHVTFTEVSLSMDNLNVPSCGQPASKNQFERSQGLGEAKIKFPLVLVSQD